VFPTRRYVGGINTVVSRANLREVPRLIRFASALGMAIALIPIHLDTAQAATVQLDGARMALTAADAPAVNEVFAEARALKRKGFRVYNSDRFLAACIPFLTTGRVDWTCDSPLLYFSISSSGKLLPCVDLPGRHSLLDDDFLQAWRSGAIVRELQAEVARCPGCMYACYPELSYLLHSKAMFIRRALDFVRLRAPSQPITMQRIRRLVDEL
jgi:MoaA/NifB/PqqE/SkfB family radical SAM enzyme